MSNDTEQKLTAYSKKTSSCHLYSYLMSATCKVRIMARKKGIYLSDILIRNFNEINEFIPVFKKREITFKIL